MQSLKEMREKYLASQEAARKAEQDKVILELEKQAKKIDVQACREAFTKKYVETGQFTDPVPRECATKWELVAGGTQRLRTLQHMYHKKQPDLIMEVNYYYEYETPVRIYLNPENMFQ